MSIRMIEFDTVDEALEWERRKKEKERVGQLNRLYNNLPQDKMQMTPKDIGDFARKQDRIIATPQAESEAEEIPEPQPETEKVAPAQNKTIVVRPSHWRERHFKPYDAAEIEEVKQEYAKRGILRAKDIRRLANRMRIHEGRVMGIYYRFREQWVKEKPAAKPAQRFEAVTKQEIDTFKEYIKSLPRTAKGKLPRGSLLRYAKLHRVHKNRVAYLAQCSLVGADVAAKDLKTERYRWINKRALEIGKQDPHLPANLLYSRARQEWDEHKGLGKSSPEGTGKPQAKAKVTDEDLVFPAIFPLAEGAVKTFEQMMIDLIARKPQGKIDYYIASANLQLRQGREWDYLTWIEFCKQVLANAKQIARALVGCDAAKIRLEKVGRSLVIRYG